jgi:phospholipase/carboxylesterase
MLLRLCLPLLLLAGLAHARPADPLDHLVLLTGGATASETVPMVIAIHGLGDRPESFQGLFRGYPGKLRVIVPRAPTPYGRGSSWFRIERPPGAAMVSDMRASTEKLAALIRIVTQRYPTRGKPIVTGFSQGGMLSFALAVAHPDAIRGAIPIAGLLPKSMWPTSGKTAPIRALHGTADNRVPYKAAEALVLHLMDRGGDVHLTPFAGVRHQVPPPVRAALYAGIQAWTAPVK